MGVRNENLMVKSYQEFSGIHWETGTLHNALAHLEVINPHTGAPFTEAMLLGIGGGITLLYAVEDHADSTARVVLRTRTPLDMIERVCQRLEIECHVYESMNAARATTTLQNILCDGRIAIVWADRNSLPYNIQSEATPVMLPLLVFGYDEAADEFHIADRAHVPLAISSDVLAAARTRQSDLNHRFIILAPPDKITEKRLKQAVLAGIRDCVRFALGRHPKGIKAVTGLPAFLKWGEALVDRRGKRSWIQLFPPGEGMLSALMSVYQQIEMEGTGGSASRRMYADFLEESCQLLQQSDLKSAAGLFRISADLWDELVQTLLPEEEKLFREVRNILLRRHYLFIEHGIDSLGEMQVLTAQLKLLESEICANFPMSDQKAATLRGLLREKIHQIYEVEENAVQAMQRALGQG